MKIKEGLVLRQICGEHIITGEGLAQVNFNKMIALNETAAWLWEQVCDKEFTPESLAALLLERYEVTEDVALTDARNVAQAWVDAGIAEA